MKASRRDIPYSARQLAMILGVQPSTITRDIKRGKLSASRDERGGYLIEASEIVRAYGDRVTVDVAGNVAATVQAQRDATGHATHATPPATDATAVLAARLEAAERLLAEREQTIDDLRRRLDSEAEERRRLTARLAAPMNRLRCTDPNPLFLLASSLSKIDCRLVATS